jgi:hypothetical protein
MHCAYLLIVTALCEVGIGLVLLVWPSLPLALLLGVEHATPEVHIVARIAGAALLALGVTCWLVRSDRHSPAQPGVTTGVLIYDVAAAVILACAGLFLGFAGVVLWPGVVLHTVLAVWCVGCLAKAPRSR